MQTDFPVILDACVMAAPALCDLYLRLAETPRLYTPHWSSEILEEVRRTQMIKYKKPFDERRADHWHDQVTRAFPEALVTGWEALLPAMANDEKDRHVLAAAVRVRSSLIVTFNLKHFPTSALRPHNVDAVHPQDYLLTLWSMNPAVVMAKLAAMAHDSKTSADIQDVLIRLGKIVPRFSCQILQDMGGDPENSD